MAYKSPSECQIAVDHHFFQAIGMLLSFLAVIMVPTSMPTAFAIELLPRQAVPSLNLQDALPSQKLNICPC